jgi:hypothetical protein
MAMETGKPAGAAMVGEAVCEFNEIDESLSRLSIILHVKS